MEIIYWVIFIIWIVLIWKFKRKSEFSLYIAAAFWVGGVLMYFINLNLAENIMRISMLGWLIGIFVALVEYIKSEKKA